ncbi:hypothetical protein GQX73_g230 [Xylaria multiplex]|uniref:Uncharacterized protein n=1 Tax=Xylaria multiplex TaxID=323545 RepID=A0A7C8MY84_9PEZI|nr:hypothetical protein GQX73_g230 [Xylaria multiplex]
MVIYAKIKSISVLLRVYLGHALMNLVTLPYYRYFRQNTLIPIKTIIKSYEHGGESDNIYRMFAAWQDRKLIELHFVQVAATLLSGAVIGCFSWIERDKEHWLGPASWYCCLILSLFAILLSSTEALIFNTIKSPENSISLRDRMSMICEVKGTVHNPAPSGDKEKGKLQMPQTERAIIRWNMVFTWQAPMMLLAYSVIAFLMGVTIYITTPLYTDDLSLGGKSAAIFYLVGLFIGGAVFVWCSFWAHRFVNLDEPRESPHLMGRL